jgi:acyl carrier protein
MTLTLAEDDLRAIVIEALQRKLREAGRHEVAITGGTNLLELDIVDSQGLLDIILEIEARCGRQFDPEGIDFEGGITLDSLTQAFAVRS